jgi:TatD DNase family protein
MAEKEIEIIDAHTHVQFHQYEKDRLDVIKRALEKKIGMINAGADLESSKKALELANEYDYGLWATAGVHPTEFKDFDKLEEIKTLASSPKVVGIGECGLDYFWTKEADLQKKQIEIFENHIQISNEIKKPLVIHCRNAFSDTIKILSANKSKLLQEPGIIHFFSGSLDDAKKLLDLNFSFTFGGLITFNRSFDDIIKYIPIEKILVETDAPFVAPAPIRGKRNEPAFVDLVLEQLAKIKELSFDLVREEVLKNTFRVFRISN